MLEDTRGVLVAVSGGPDSVALLDMLKRISARGDEPDAGDEQEAKATGLAGARPSTPNTHLHVAHLDHMLRGCESEEDAEFTRELADRLRVRITIESVDVRAAAEASKRSLEEVAREIRYDFLLRVAGETGCDRIAVGHTMTDQAETFLMRLIRGAGLRGLASMRPVSAVPRARAAEIAQSPRLPIPSSPLLIRPLLCITREEVEGYCNERDLVFRSDATNESLHYTRNRVRRQVIPSLASINPRVVKSIARAAENLASDQDALDQLALSLLERGRIEYGSHASADHASAAYSVSAFLEQPAGLMRRRMIIEALRLARDSSAGNNGIAGEVTSKHVKAVEALLEPDASGKRVILAGRFEVWREFDSLVFKGPMQAAQPGAYRYSISAANPDANAGDFALTLQRGVPGQVLGSVIERTKSEKLRTGLNWMAVALEDRALPGQLIIRPRQPGERALVVGQRRTKKLKTLMIDHRIPSSRRANWPIVTTPDGRYVWSPGLPPASEFAVHDQTQVLAIIWASAA